MPSYRVETTQEFLVTYKVEGDSYDDAWDNLMDSDGEAECVEQIPSRMLGDRASAVIVEDD